MLACPSILPANVQGRVGGRKPTVRRVLCRNSTGLQVVRVLIADDYYRVVAEGLSGEQMDKCRFVRQGPLVWPESNGPSCEPLGHIPMHLLPSTPS